MFCVSGHEVTRPHPFPAPPSVFHQTPQARLAAQWLVKTLIWFDTVKKVNNDLHFLNGMFCENLNNLVNTNMFNMCIFQGEVSFIDRVPYLYYYFFWSPLVRRHIFWPPSLFFLFFYFFLWVSHLRLFQREDETDEGWLNLILFNL